jgi:hypothetical protein
VNLVDNTLNDGFLLELEPDASKHPDGIRRPRHTHRFSAYSDACYQNRSVRAAKKGCVALGHGAHLSMGSPREWTQRPRRRPSSVREFHEPEGSGSDDRKEVVPHPADTYRVTI